MSPVISTPEQIGKYGENRVAWYYRLRGYKILERNYRAAYHEIDLIAENRTTLVIVEVKTRTEKIDAPLRFSPASAVNQHKKDCLLQAARSYILSTDKKKPIRFDIAEVILTETKVGKVKIRIHVRKNAFYI